MLFRDQHELRAYLEGARIAATKVDRPVQQATGETEREAQVLAVLREAGAL
jgi:hypothetical protein